jgi:hypothetical protein
MAIGRQQTWDGGAEPKRLALRDGKIVNDSSARFLANGCTAPKSTACRRLQTSLNSFSPSEAYAQGRAAGSCSGRCGAGIMTTRPPIIIPPAPECREAAA